MPDVNPKSLISASAMLGLMVLMSGSLLSACSFENRSNAFECPIGDECDPGRVCSNGWCVLPGTDIDADTTDLPDAQPGAADADLRPDASIPVADAAPPPDAPFCPSECTSCTNGICVIECDGAADCALQVVCPSGMDCRVSCGGANSCGLGVDCTQATDCLITCDGDNSCASLVECGPGVCSIACTGTSSCITGHNCEASCQCDTACTGICGPSACPGNNACVSGGLCNSTPGSCKTCVP